MTPSDRDQTDEPISTGKAIVEGAGAFILSLVLFFFLSIVIVSRLASGQWIIVTVLVTLLAALGVRFADRYRQAPVRRRSVMRAQLVGFAIAFAVVGVCDVIIMSG